MSCVWSVLFLCNVSQQSDIKEFVCIFIIVIVDRFTKLLPGLLSYYVLFYSFNSHIHKSFWLIGFVVALFYSNNPMFCKTNSSGKCLDTRQKILYAAPALTKTGQHLTLVGVTTTLLVYDTTTQGTSVTFCVSSVTSYAVPLTFYVSWRGL